MGIGTTVPGAKVDVVGDIWAGNGSSGNRGIYLGNITAQASLLYDSNSGNLDITPRSGYNSVFTAGNVGIGTTVPSYKLHAYQSGNTSQILMLEQGTTAKNDELGYKVNGTVVYGVGTNLSLADDHNYEIYDRSSSASRFLINSSGNVGIGSTVPGQVLDVSGNIRTRGTNELYFGDDNKAGILASAATTPDMKFLTNSTEYMRITNGGNVGIGTTTPQHKLDIAGANIRLSNAQANFILNDNGATADSDQIIFRRNDANVSGIKYDTLNSKLNFYSGDFTTIRLGITSAGIVSMPAYGAGTATFDGSGNISSVSDERLKIIQGRFPEGLAEILKINPILYKYNALSRMDTVNTYAGFSAQNVMQYIPEAVGISSNGYYTFNDRPIITALVNAVKTLQSEIDALRAALSLSPNVYNAAAITDGSRIIKSPSK